MFFRVSTVVCALALLAVATPNPDKRWGSPTTTSSSCTAITITEPPYTTTVTEPPYTTTVTKPPVTTTVTEPPVTTTVTEPPVTTTVTKPPVTTTITEPPVTTTVTEPPITTTLTVSAPASTVTTASQCNTGPIQCCQNVQKASSSAAGLVLGLLGIVLNDLDVLVGLNCSPISVIDVGSGNACSASPVCCENNSYGSLISIGCVPVTL